MLSRARVAAGVVDRGIGLMGLVFVAAIGSTSAARMSDKIGPIGPGILWAVLAAAFAVGAPAVLMPHRVAALLRPLRALHQEWFEERITRLTAALSKFRLGLPLESALALSFIGAVLVMLFSTSGAFVYLARRK